MSRNNNDLPMLPPWLSESDVTTTGYEAPVQNLPHQELIPEDSGSRRLFSRKADDRGEPDKKKRKSRRKDKPGDTPSPAESSSWGPPESAVPRDEPPAPRPDAARNTDHGSGPTAWQQPPEAAEYRPQFDQLPAPEQPYAPAPQPPVHTPPPAPTQPANHTPPATGPVPTRPGPGDQVPPQSASRPPIPPAPQHLPTPPVDSGDEEMTVRVSRRPDLPPSPTPPQQAAPPPPPLPDWSQAASPQQPGPPARLGVPEQYGTESAASQPLSTAPQPEATGDSGNRNPSATGIRPDSVAYENESSATSAAESGPPAHGAQDAPDWLTGTPPPGPFTPDSASAATEDGAQHREHGPAAESAPHTGGFATDTAYRPDLPASPHTSGSAPPGAVPHSPAPAPSRPDIPVPPPYAPAPESQAYQGHSGPVTGQLPDIEQTTVAPQGFSQPRIPQQKRPRTEEFPTPVDRAPVSDSVAQQSDPQRAAQAPGPDPQWQTGDRPPTGAPPQAPGPAPQWNAPQQRPDQYSQPQQYAQPNPYTQGPQQGSADQYQQSGQQAAQYQQEHAQYQQEQQYQQAPPPQYQQGQQQYQPGAVGPALGDVPMRRAKKAPGSGWRRAVHHMSGGAINPGMSAEEMRLQELVARIRQPVRGDYRIATLSLKGGVGKTTTTMGIGSIFASIRGDRVIAVDANPDFGTLSQRVPLQTRSSVRDLLLDQSLHSYGDVRRHTSQATSRLEVLASERDPAASESFSEDEYRQVLRVLQRFYNIILTDCGTGLMHSAMAGVLDLAHSLVLISSSAIDGARSAAATLDWLSLHGHDHLVRNAVVVINLPREGSPNVAIQHLREYFLARCRAVHVIPYDPHLAEGAEIDLARLHKNTKRALVELAATVADDFATDHRPFTGY